MDIHVLSLFFFFFFLHELLQAMDDECAEETWVWIYVFLVFSVPTVIGSILALIQSGLQACVHDALRLF